MRNLFDQYTQPENRLTHALLCCLAEDRALLKAFVQWSTGHSIHAPEAIEIREQSLPGYNTDYAKADAEERSGLPDGCLSDDSGWALLIESKFQANVNPDQLKRHLREAERRGLDDATVLVLTVKPFSGRLPDHVLVKPWNMLYRWLQQEMRRSRWATELTQYMEIAETRGAADNYLTEGALTVFAGIPFGKNNETYSYPQAKRLLRLLRDELVQDKRLNKILGMDQGIPGRGAITGRASDAVWDYLGLAQSKGVAFTKFPHLTFAIGTNRLEAYVTVPNSIQPKMRSKMLGDDFEDFEQLIAKVTTGLLGVIKAAPKAVPRVVAVQRHYLSQRSAPDIDCILRFDPRTAIRPTHGESHHAKLQPQWLQATYDALRSRKSNLQFQIGIDFPYDACPAVATHEIATHIADTWLACEPLIAKTMDASD